MPNLENLRKQAKLYVRWHREGYYPVAAQIRAVLPRFKDLTDRQVLEHAFRLSDAQELVARQSGFESWQALKTGVQAMPATAKPVSRWPIFDMFMSPALPKEVPQSMAPDGVQCGTIRPLTNGLGRVLGSP